MVAQDGTVNEKKEVEEMIKKRLVWLVILGVLYTGLMGAGSCGKKALDAIGDAKTAVEDARAANAPKYAADQFKSAEDNLLLAQQEYDRYQFKKSESSALAAEPWLAAHMQSIYSCPGRLPAITSILSPTTCRSKRQPWLSHWPAPCLPSRMCL